ncbi:molybdenum cofactor guanylyltransferase [Halothiobacillus sp.]|uniref:molybdenum cofactor guanylyltransferase n=1 Tax=Halothiobacillus sp. TaxID=1891311 RepID=UPI002AD4052D|nr:molybdenum cofactor guanylyltransferase [Halothiobacillus sp.]
MTKTTFDRRPYPPTTAIVLAGGAGRRMMGNDKGLLPFRDGCLIEPILAALAPQVDQLIISANRHLTEYRVFGFPVVSDPTLADGEPEYAGPVAALRHVSTFAEHDWLLLAPCDMPGFRPHWHARLWATQRASRAAVVIAHDGERLQPTVALIHRPCLAQRPDQMHSTQRTQPPADLAKRGQRLTELLMAGRYALCDLSEDRPCFANINTPEELAALPDPHCDIPPINRKSQASTRHRPA